MDIKYPQPFSFLSIPLFWICMKCLKHPIELPIQIYHTMRFCFMQIFMDLCLACVLVVPLKYGRTQVPRKIWTLRNFLECESNPPSLPVKCEPVLPVPYRDQKTTSFPFAHTYLKPEEDILVGMAALSLPEFLAFGHSSCSPALPTGQVTEPGVFHYIQ